MLKIVFFVMLSLMLMAPGTVFAEESSIGQKITLTTEIIFARAICPFS